MKKRRLSREQFPVTSTTTTAITRHTGNSQTSLLWEIKLLINVKKYVSDDILKHTLESYVRGKAW